MNINNIHKPKIICASTVADHIDPAKGVKRVGGEGGGGALLDTPPLTLPYYNLSFLVQITPL